MNDAELAQLEHENMITALFDIVENAPGTLVRRSEGVATLLTGLPPRLFNQIIIDGAPTDDAVARAVESAKERGDPFCVNLRVGVDDRYLSLMGRLGLGALSEKPWMPGMAASPITAGAPNAGDHQIVRASDAKGVKDHITTGAAGFDMPEEWLRLFVGVGLLNRPGVSIYTGYVRGEPVSTGLGYVTGRTIGIYNISTVPKARKHGYGAQMTQRIIDDGLAAGCDVAILQASAMGFPIYERLGFRTVVEYMGYVEPGSETAESMAI